MGELKEYSNEVDWVIYLVQSMTTLGDDVRFLTREPEGKRERF